MRGAVEPDDATNWNPHTHTFSAAYLGGRDQDMPGRIDACEGVAGPSMTVLVSCAATKCRVCRRILWPGARN